MLENVRVIAFAVSELLRETSMGKNKEREGWRKNNDSTIESRKKERNSSSSFHWVHWTNLKDLKS